MIQVFLAGNLGKDAETREVGMDTVTKFTVACSTGKKDETQWVTCSMWGERGSRVAPYLTKGKTVSVTGRVSARHWTTKEGAVQIELECRVGELTLLGGGKSEGVKRVDGGSARAPAKAPQDDFDSNFNDDDIAF